MESPNWAIWNLGILLGNHFFETGPGFRTVTALFAFSR